jgi:hypothetical protein
MFQNIVPHQPQAMNHITIAQMRLLFAYCQNLYGRVEKTKMYANPSGWQFASGLRFNDYATAIELVYFDGNSVTYFHAKKD